MTVSNALRSSALPVVEFQEGQYGLSRPLIGPPEESYVRIRVKIWSPSPPLAPKLIERRSLVCEVSGLCELPMK